ncbi:CbiQ family ECF transporter T component [Euzebya sp.]|uniref:CbiQ family ECF transporter T component n=1 Tax=Euzebya sp. TaxID=1971409 RepID=UPI0035116D18
MRTRPARPLHPAAWWLWALGLATAASRTTNLLLLALILAVVLTVVAARRPAAPWALGLRTYLLLAATVVVLRVAFRVVLGADVGPTVLFTLPELPLPDVAAGIRLGGPVSAEGLVAALQDGLRLATLLVAVGAANLLADPKRLLTHLPAALHEIGSTVVVALTVAPQLVTSIGRVRRARRLRGGNVRGLRPLGATLMPVLEDALDRSIALAAAMDARGYGRSRHVPLRQRTLTAGLLLAGVCGLCIGLYGLLDGTAPRALGSPMLVLGTLLAAAGTILAGRRVGRTVHRPDRWAAPEVGVAVLGVVAGAAVVLAGQWSPAAVYPPVPPLTWPELPTLAGAGVVAALLAAVVAPPPEAVSRR